MKNKSILIFLSMFLIFFNISLLVSAQCMSHSGSKMTNATNDQEKQIKSDQAPMVYYTCKMHPEILMEKPGKCPTCGMDLLKMQGMLYTCSMHPEVLSLEPGKCPKCSMDLIKKQTASYTCSMHPEVISNKPGTCPKCGMELILKDSTGATKSHGGCGMMH